MNRRTGVGAQFPCRSPSVQRGQIRGPDPAATTERHRVPDAKVRSGAHSAESARRAVAFRLSSSTLRTSIMG